MAGGTYLRGPWTALTPLAQAARTALGPEPQEVAISLPDDLWSLSAPLAGGHQVDLCLQCRAAIHAIQDGSADYGDANVLAEASNLAMVIAEHGIGGEYIDVVHEAQEALMRIKQRVNKARDKALRQGTPPQMIRDHYVGDGPGLQALKDLVELHEQQLAHEDCTAAVVIWALQETRKRIAFGNVLRCA